MRQFIKYLIPLSVLASSPALAESFLLESKDIAHGKFMGNAQEFQGFGCSGGNMSPQLSWRCLLYTSSCGVE